MSNPFMRESTPRPLLVPREINPRLDRPLVSILVPVFNEEEAVGLFIETTSSILQASDLNFEMIFIDDGSQDGTLARLLCLAEVDKRIRLIRLSRNFGKEAALSAGIDYAEGDVLVPMDVDLQDPPALIPMFLERWRQGYDVVYGVRSSRKHDKFSKRTSAVWFYRLFNRLSEVKLPINAGDFRLIDRRVADVLRLASSPMAS